MLPGMTTDEIRIAAETAAARERVSPSTICRWATGQGGLYYRLQSGQGCTVNTAQKLLTWIAERDAHHGP